MKRGQIELSFGMIFSIILVIAFLGFAFYAIKTFIGFENSAKAGKFFDQIQGDIDRIWKSAQSSEQQDYIIPSGADFTCFVDFSSSAKGTNSTIYSELKKVYSGTENLAFYPINFAGFGSRELKNLNITKTTAEENPFCIKTNNGKVTLVLKKDFGEALVRINKP